MCSLQTKVLPVVKIKTNPDKNVIITDVRKKFYFCLLERGHLGILGCYIQLYLYYWVFMLLKSLIKMKMVVLRNRTPNPNHMLMQTQKHTAAYQKKKKKKKGELQSYLLILRKHYLLQNKWKKLQGLESATHHVIPYSKEKNSEWLPSEGQRKTPLSHGLDTMTPFSYRFLLSVLQAFSKNNQ